MGFQASTYNINFCPNFLKLFMKIEKVISFMSIYFFLIGAWEQKLCPNKLKTGETGQQKKFTKF